MIKIWTLIVVAITAMVIAISGNTPAERSASPVPLQWTPRFSSTPIHYVVHGRSDGGVACELYDPLVGMNFERQRCQRIANQTVVLAFNIDDMGNVCVLPVGSQASACLWISGEQLRPHR